MRPEPKNPRAFLAIEKLSKRVPVWSPMKHLPVMISHPESYQLANGPKLARHFARYKRFTSGEWGIPCSQRRAAALTDIARILRWLREHSAWGGTCQFRAVEFDARYEKTVLDDEAIARNDRLGR